MLVILAILAAILVPKLIGWIDESKAKTAMAEAHLVLSALQADASSKYANDLTANYIRADVEKYLAGDADISGSKLNLVKYTQDAKLEFTGGILSFIYRASNGKTVSYLFDEKTGKGNFTIDKVLNLS